MTKDEDLYPTQPGLLATCLSRSVYQEVWRPRDVLLPP